MVFTKLKGGLGNQMFQYAAARGVNGNSYPVYLDTTYLTANSKSSESFTARDFELHLFKHIKAKVASKGLLDFVFSYEWYYRFLRACTFFKTEQVTQTENEWIDGLRHKKKNVYLDGFFQSEKYFNHIREALLLEFKFPELDTNSQILLRSINTQLNAVSIHVRRGDYLKPNVLKYHGILPEQYYRQAIGMIEEECDNAHYFIFSNDTEWCKKTFHFIQGRFTIIEPNDAASAWKEMYLMTQCRHHIVANSSFSWWGAWLSEKQGMNLAPSRWFNPDVAKFNINDIVPSSWKIVYYE
jgi:hypothetical protein